LNNQKNALEDQENQKSAGKLRMLMFGKPGAGKGTLTSRLVRRYDIVSLSTGDLLRQHIAEKTEVGREAEAIVAQGGLIPDETMLKVVTSKLDSLMNKVCVCVSNQANAFNSAHTSSALDPGWFSPHVDAGQTT
jgi:nucleoside-triphosphate--adenylate kinase